MTRRARLASLAVAVLSTIACRASADIVLGSLFNDHMVLQRDHANLLWGTAAPGAEVTVSMDSHVVDKTKADDKGAFKLKVPAHAADTEPHALLIRSGDDFVALGDILIGDVWVCGGQSNMKFFLQNCVDGEKEVAAADQPTIRLYKVPEVAAPEPMTTMDAKWKTCTPENVAEFSGVGYFFGRHLTRELKVPIGLIHTNWGGTPAEGWTPLAKLETLKDLPLIGRGLERRAHAAERGVAEKYLADMKDWLKATGRDDQAIKPNAIGWEKVDVADASAWKTMKLPGDFTKEGVPNGCVWFRKTIDIPSDAEGKPARITLGRIDEYDTTFFNGEKVGETGPLPPEDWQKQRSYLVPAELVKASKATIAVRVFDTGKVGGMIGPPTAMAIKGSSFGPVSLAGDWSYRQESEWKPVAGKEPPRPVAPMTLDHPATPSALYNGMIAPLGEFGIKGVIWYQGENNAPRNPEYKPLLTALIEGWRDQFKQGDFPFYIVGLANFTPHPDAPNDPSEWAPLREAQRQVSRSVKNTAMSVTIDIGEPLDIHPKNKQEVGRRLALIALHDTYGKTETVSRGPTVAKAEFKDDKVVVEFENIGKGLKSIAEPLGSFELAGEDGKWVEADAKIDDDGDEVIVSSAKVTKPRQVRYAYADNPKATLFNAEGLPAEPFIEAKK